MLNILRKKNGQNTAEYAILVALVVAAAVAMQTYVKRNLQAGVKYTVDKVKRDSASTGQYEPYYLETDYATERSTYTNTEETQLGGGVTRTYGAGGDVQETSRTGYQKLRATTSE